MPRVLALAATALLIIWQGGCLTIYDGALINRCGLWQFATGNPVVIALRMPNAQIVIEREKIIERIVEKQTVPAQPAMAAPIVIYRQGYQSGVPIVTSSGVTMTYDGAPIVRRFRSFATSMTLAD